MKIRTFFGLAWQPVLAYGAVLLTTLILLFYRLGSLLPGLSTPEVKTATFSGNFHNIAAYPVFAPYTGLNWLLHKLSLVSPFSLRAISALYGLIILVFFYLLMRRWFSMRMAIMGSVLFGTSSWFLHTVRLATPAVLLMSLVVLVFPAIALKRSSHPQLALTLTVISCAGLIYLSGLVWFVLAGAVWQRRQITKILKEYNPVSVALNGCLFVLLIVPLIWSVLHHPHLLVTLAGVPPQIPSFKQMVVNVANVPIYLFIRGPLNPVMWLGRLPLLDVFTTALFFLGLYTYALHLRLEQSLVLIGIAVIGLILIGLNGPLNVTLLLPWVYVIATTGLVYFLQLWLSVFPRNPVARGIGYSLVIVAVVITCGYHMLSYFVAWPRNAATKTVFTQQIASK